MNKLEYQRQYVNAHREELNNKRKIYEKGKYDTDPVWVENKKKRHKDWYQKNKNTFLNKERERYHKNKEVIQKKRKERLLNETSEQREKRLAFHREYNKKNRGIFSIKNQTDRNKYNQYINSAHRRSYDFDLSYDEFVIIFHSNCTYCGKEESRGIDRIKNDIGYTKENSTPCCETCNKMKWKYNKSMFLEHIKKISNYNK